MLRYAITAPVALHADLPYEQRVMLLRQDIGGDKRHDTAMQLGHDACRIKVLAEQPVGLLRVDVQPGAAMQQCMDPVAICNDRRTKYHTAHVIDLLNLFDNH